MQYLEKDLKEYDILQLQNILAGLNRAEGERNKHRSHEKFNVDRKIGSKTIPKMNFPEPNTEFVKLKLAIEEEIKNRNKDNA